MEIYKTIRNIAAATFLAALPTICEPSCAYSPSKVEASEIKYEARAENPSTETLETLTLN